MFLEGAGLERVHFTVQPPGVITPPAGGIVVPPADLALAPQLTCGTTTAPAIRLKNCAAVPGVQGALGCQADADGPDGICTSKNFQGNVQDKDPNHNRGVLLVRGLWDGTAAWQDAPDVVTLSCDFRLAAKDSQGKDMQFKAGDGAITHCVRDFELDPATQRDAFLACIRMARADYCGDGITHTFTGTEIRVSTPTNPTTTQECTDGKCFEASWSKDGAVCIAHVRYAGPNAEFDSCRDQFQLAGRMQCRAPAAQGIVVSHSRPRTCGQPSAGKCPQNDDLDPVCATP